MKVRDVINILEEDGWYQVRMRESHRQFHHRTKRGTVTLAGHPGADVPPGILKAIWRQAQLDEKL